MPILQRLRRSFSSAAALVRFPMSGARRRGAQRQLGERDCLRSPVVGASQAGTDAHTIAMWACLDALPECAWTATAGGEIDFLNVQWHAHTGSPRGDDVGYAWAKHVHPDDVGAALQDWTVALRTRMPMSRVARVRGFNGDYRWFLVRARPVLDGAGNVMRWIGLNTDIHDRYTAEQQVLRERALLRDVLEQIPAAVIVGEAPSGKVIVHNRRMAQLWRCPSSTLASYGSISEYNSKPLKMWHLDGRPYRQEDWPLAQVIQGGCTIIDGMATFERMDGTRGTLCVNAAPVKDSEGVIIAGVVIVEDMQNRLAAEEERVRLRADEAAARKTAELKQLLMANVSHEMRTPLNAIIGMGSVLLSDAAVQRSLLTAEQIQCITDMRDSGQLLLTLVDDILTFSHLEAGKLPLSPAPFQLQQLVTRATNMLAAAAHEKLLTVATRIDPDLPDVVVGDELRLRQVLVNLMSNAVKFTPEGGQISVHLASAASHTVTSSAQQLAMPSEQLSLTSMSDAEHHPPSATTWGCNTDEGVSLHASNENSHTGPVQENAEDVYVGRPPGLRIQFNVEDTGIGVSKDALPRLFKPFSQADATTTRKYGGTGLGLSICKRLVETMGGDIGVAQCAARGACFWFEVPLFAVSPSVAISEAAIATPSWEPDEGACSTAPSARARPAHDERCALEYAAEPTAALSSVSMSGQGPSTGVQQDARPLSGLRLLVAEDNTVNQRVVHRILARLGADVTIVENGAAAVHAVTTAQPTFHAVLMDCAMPVCDGYEATKLIRDLPDAGRRNVPIIALTAGALPEDVRRSLESGMNAHLAKPLDPANLITSVRRFAGASHS